ncbi:MAG TPA: sulfotransferase domain-containing protein [Kiloniellales bacterium]|nr:sulfotransferase domain-containing protein [Kiloniellales bacterium]
MRSVIETLIREGALLCLFFLPRDRRIVIERRIRGRFEWQKLRGCDVVVVSFGKSGRTWLRVMMSRLYQKRHGLPERMLLQYDNMHRRRREVPKVHFSHDNYLKDYTGRHDDKSDYRGTPVVLLARHPADTVVSQYFQWKYRMRDRKKQINDYPAEGAEVSVYDFAMNYGAGLAKIVDFMNLWAREVPQLQSLLLVRYEDMRENPGEELARVMEFIGTPAKEAEIAEAVDFASVENMRKMESQRTFWLSGSRMTTRDKDNPNAYKVRRAKVGGWRDYFEPDQIAVIEDYLAEHLDPLYGYTGAAKASEKAISGS